MSYNTVIQNLVHMSTHAKDYEPKKIYEYYVSCNDSFFGDKQIVLCETYEDAQHIAKSFKYYNYEHKKAMKTPYTYISIGTTENFKINPKQSYGILFDNKYSWWNNEQPYASLKGKSCKVSTKKTTTRKITKKTNHKNIALKASKITLDKHIWEGWTIKDIIENNMMALDMIATHQSWQQPFKNKTELKEYLKDNIMPAGCRKPTAINQLTEFFAKRYGIKN